jgi:hypothetical protein
MVKGIWFNRHIKGKCPLRKLRRGFIKANCSTVKRIIAFLAKHMQANSIRDQIANKPNTMNF